MCHVRPLGVPCGRTLRDSASLTPDKYMNRTGTGPNSKNYIRGKLSLICQTGSGAGELERNYFSLKEPA